MKHIETPDRDYYRNMLQNIYSFNKCIYSLPFKKRLLFELGAFRIQVKKSSKIASLSEKELEGKIINLKKPWWNWVFFWSKYI